LRTFTHSLSEFCFCTTHDARVLLLRSSALLIHKRLSESLSGRFFLHRLRHRQYPGISRAFDIPLEAFFSTPPDELFSE